MKQDQIFYRAEVHLIEGGQDYDIMGWSQEQVVLDMLNLKTQNTLLSNMITNLGANSVSI